MQKMKKLTYEQVIEKAKDWHRNRCNEELFVNPELGSLIGGLVDSINENIEYGNLLNPRFWTKEMHDAWHTNLPDVQRAFDALRKIGNDS